MEDLDPVSAASAQAPHGYYGRLAKECPFSFDERAGAWVAASAEAVETVLTCEALKVRPAAEPVPKAMAGTTLGAIFSRLARMNDDARHASLRNIAIELLEKWDADVLASTAREIAQRLARSVALGDRDLNAYCRDIAPAVIATMLHMRAGKELCEKAGDLARAIAPAASSEDIARGVEAAEYLKRSLPAWLGSDAAANALGFFFQSYETTAALIASTLAALSADDEARERSMREEAALCKIIDEVARRDPPVQNTRRFAAGDLVVMGQRVSSGQPVVVLLASANADAAGERSYTFGFGEHACPGSAIAIAIAKAGVKAAFERDLLANVEVARYRRSAIFRIPEFVSTAKRS
jgi:cytochrome P450